jgi:acetylornithine deacetylase/succinyl-diaminopimelate desuccinylase-like protein
MRTLFVSILLMLALMPLALAAPRSPVDEAADAAPEVLSQYLRINTANPPGNEQAACEFLEGRLAAAGIPSTVWTSAPGRANLYAVLEGSDPKLGSLILLSHSDVVPADARYWKQPPFSGAITKGEIWGRGAVDMKGMGIMELQAFIALHQAKIPLARDVVLLVVADEEMGADAGIKWVMANHPEIFRNVAGVINEEGPGLVEGRRLKYWEVRPGQKGLVWLWLQAKGRAGHASLPHSDAAPNRLVRALSRVLAWQTPIRVLPEAQQFFTQLAALEPDRSRAEGMRHLASALEQAPFREWFLSHPVWNAMVRNTISLTRLEGSNKTNVIPPVARAALDCRLLPGEDSAAFVARIRKLVAQDGVEVIADDVEKSVPASSVDTSLFHVIHDVIEKYFPKTLVVTPYSRAANDSRYFQERGIVSYGFVPLVLTEAELNTQHGNNERVSVENVERGVHMLYDVAVGFGSR